MAGGDGSTKPKFFGARMERAVGMNTIPLSQDEASLIYSMLEASESLLCTFEDGPSPLFARMEGLRQRLEVECKLSGTKADKDCQRLMEYGSKAHRAVEKLAAILLA